MKKIIKSIKSKIIDTLPTKAAIEEIASFSNQAKNGRSVYLGDYMALTSIYTGQKVYVDTRDLSVAPHLLMDGIWEQDITKVWRDQLPQVQVVYDIGANFGWFGILSGLYSNIEEINFVEANTNLIPYLRKSCNVNGLLDKSNFINKAITKESGNKVKLNVIEDYWGSSSLHDIVAINKDSKLKLKEREKIEIATLSIDDLIKDKLINEKKILIKLDIEGFEEDALMDSDIFFDYAKKKKIIMLIEFTGNAYKNPSKFYDKLRANFSYSGLITERGEIENISDLSFDEIGKRDNMVAGDWNMMLFK